MERMEIKNILGDILEVFIELPQDSRYAWDLKDLTKNCSECPRCIGKKEAMSVIGEVLVSKGRSRWRPPLRERIMGLCVWGKWTQILVPKEDKLKKCQYFGKPSTREQ